MPVLRIERIEAGKVLGQAVVSSKSGKFHCHADGDNKHPVKFGSLDDVATFLIGNPGSGVRMSPKFSKVVENIHIDGIPR